VSNVNNNDGIGELKRPIGAIERVTGDSDLTVAALLRSLIGGTEATGHEAEAKFQKKTQ
jgi:hypothetical protein